MAGGGRARGSSMVVQRSTPGFSIPELLIVIGVVGVLLAISIPSLGGARSTAYELKSLSNIRQIGLATVQYADAWKGTPPVIFQPKVGFIGIDQPQEVETQWGVAWGYWFMSTSLYQLAFDEPLPGEVTLAPRNPEAESDTRGVFQPDYLLAESLYATPEYFDRFTQTAPEQWVPQRLERIRFPASKAIAHQVARYDIDTPSGLAMTCCFGDLPPSSVLWGDLSAVNINQGSLLPGEPNFYHHGSGPGGSLLGDGAPIDATKHGVLGRDR